MRAPSLNRPARTTVALLLAAVLGCTLAGCGGSGGNGSGAPIQAHETAAVVLKRTFRSGKQIQSGQLNLDVKVSGTGSTLLAEPAEIKASGPFEEAGEGKLPRFEVSLEVVARGHALTAGAISVGGKLYVELEGSAFVLPGSTMKALEESYAQARKGAGEQSGLAALGIEPARWLAHPSIKGEPTIEGEKTTEIEGGLDLPALLKDANRFSGAAGSTGLAGVAGSLSPSLVSSIAKAVKSAVVTVYTGNEDHLMRRLKLNAAIAPKGEAKQALGGLTSAQLELELSFSHLDEPQKIEAPANAKPLSNLLQALEGVGLVGQTS
ncbi:MAG: hypothetical protein ACYCU0_01465 [Solirubrobacteraceae bacterium]